VVIAIIGIACLHLQGGAEVTLKPKERLEIGPYTVQFNDLQAGERPTHILVWANLTVLKGKTTLTELHPGQRFYPNQQSPFASVEARYHWHEDLYAILSTFERDGSSATIKVMINPMMAWIWIGGGVILLGVLVAVLPERRLAMLTMRAKTQPVEVGGGASMTWKKLLIRCQRAGRPAWLAASGRTRCHSVASSETPDFP
jgi:cytochrome c-type biogenesis protein CcmF